MFPSSPKLYPLFLKNFPCVPLFPRNKLPCSPEINCHVPLFPKTPGRASAITMGINNVECAMCMNFTRNVVISSAQPFIMCNLNRRISLGLSAGEMVKMQKMKVGFSGSGSTFLYENGSRKNLSVCGEQPMYFGEKWVLVSYGELIRFEDFLYG